MKTSLILLAVAGSVTFIGPFIGNENDPDGSGAATDYGNANLSGQTWTFIPIASGADYLTAVDVAQNLLDGTAVEAGEAAAEQAPANVIAAD